MPIQKKKRQGRGFRLSRNKRYYGSFLIAATFLIIISSTFAWMSWFEWKKNHLQGDPLVLTPQVEVQGTLGPQTLTQQAAIDRQLTVANTGQIPVFIRVALSEELVTFEIDTTDQTGNGHLKEYAAIPAGGVELQSDVLSTWADGNYYNRTASGPYLKSVGRETYAYLKSEVGRPTALTPIKLNFGDVDPVGPMTTGYWMYQEVANKGYYYYSEIVPVGDSTTPLVTTTDLTVEAPNTLKGGLHQLDAVASGGQATAGIYAEWGIPETPGNKVYDRYQELLSTP